MGGGFYVKCRFLLLLFFLVKEKKAGAASARSAAQPIEETNSGSPDGLPLLLYRNFEFLVFLPSCFLLSLSAFQNDIQHNAGKDRHEKRG